jgi:hypothetical protein
VFWKPFAQFHSAAGSGTVTKSSIQESLVALYLRLNGYFVSGFIVHADYRNMTEMDVLAVRFPYYKEPEREIQDHAVLAAPRDAVDCLVGEVKGGNRDVNFNPRFRENPQAIRTVLNRFGAFSDEEIGRFCYEAQSMLAPDNVRRSGGFPTLKTDDGRAQVRFALFAPEQVRGDRETRPYIFGNELMAFAWACFRPEQKRPLCDVRYNYELWGPQFTTLVRFFKERSRTEPGTVEDLYRWYELS